MIGENPNKVRR